MLNPKIWNDQFQRLVEYKDVHGDFHVKKSVDPKLSKWVDKQRQLYRKDKLLHDRKELLLSIGFNFVANRRELIWNDQFQRLKEYKVVHGNCNVPECFEPDKKLATWVSLQRTNNKSGILTDDRKQKLLSIGFIFDLREDKFNMKFDRLIKYKQENGNCLVPCNYKDDPQLAKWIDYLRYEKKKGSISDDRIQRLEKIGFVWSVFVVDWDNMYSQLIEQKNEILMGFGFRIDGDFGISMCPDKKRLGVWIQKQRVKRRQSVLKIDRFIKLHGVGFVWDIMNSCDRDLEIEKYSPWKKLTEDHGVEKALSTYYDTKESSDDMNIEEDDELIMPNNNDQLAHGKIVEHSVEGKKGFRLSIVIPWEMSELDSTEYYISTFVTEDQAELAKLVLEESLNYFGYDLMLAKEVAIKVGSHNDKDGDEKISGVVTSYRKLRELQQQNDSLNKKKTNNISCINNVACLTNVDVGENKCQCTNSILCTTMNDDVAKVERNAACTMNDDVGEDERNDSCTPNHDVVGITCNNTGLGTTDDSVGINDGEGTNNIIPDFTVSQNYPNYGDKTTYV